MNEQEAIQLVSDRMSEPVSVVGSILKRLEDGYGFIERLCDASSLEKRNQALEDCIPEVRAFLPLGKRAAAADSGVSRPPPRRRAEAIEEQVKFQPDEEQYALGLNEWFVKHAATLPEVCSFREKVLGGSPITTEELRDLASCFQQPVRVHGKGWRPGPLSGMTLEEAISRCREQYGQPVERLLTED
ncbi:MAG: hypothetical protein GTO63_27475, partial [Anaerolineae bacterium]|nr:hypothetical protein [Anaerolineae bacterium]NIN98471.1 hypothetical protein [Anaerolineae bacterium]NIQ81368.1 hypothetical protein [Anaerolineae bacterium]